MNHVQETTQGRVRIPGSSGLAWLVGVPALVALSVAIGALTVAFPSSLFNIAVAAAAVAVVFLAARWPGPALGIWIVAAANAVPYVDLNTLSVAGRFKLQDGLMMALVAAATLTWARRPPNSAQRRVVSFALLAVTALGAWWLLTLVRTVAVEGVPPVAAALFGRDLMYPAAAALCTAMMVRGFRAVRSALDIALVALTMYAIGYLLTVTFHVGGEGLYAMSGIASMGPGVFRGYSQGNGIAAALALVALWRALTVQGRLVVAYGFAASILAAQVIAALTRANYVGLAVGASVTIAAALVLSDYRRVLTRLSVRVAAVVMALSGIAIGYVAVVSDLSLRSNTLGFVTDRFGSIYAALVGGSSSGVITWDERVTWAQQTMAVIGDQWLWGLGFLHPSVRPFAQLVDGTLRNSHIGVLDSVAPYGVLGVLLALILPLTMLFLALHPRSRHRLQAQDMGLVMGVAGVVVSGIASAATMTMLFTSPVTGVLVGLGLSVAMGAALSEGDVEPNVDSH